MKKKILSLCCAILLMAGLFGVSFNEVKAEEGQPMIDGSYLTHEDESIGYDTKITRGVDLLAGYGAGRVVCWRKHYCGSRGGRSRDQRDGGTGSGRR